MSDRRHRPKAPVWIIVLPAAALFLILLPALNTRTPEKTEKTAESSDSEETQEMAEEETTETSETEEMEESPEPEVPLCLQRWQEGTSFETGYEEGALSFDKIDTSKMDSAAGNSDVRAYLYDSAVGVADPVFRKMGTSNPYDDYYLHHNADGSEGYPACIYMEPLNRADFTDNITVLYGHNMRDGSAFGQLRNYRDEDFFNKNRFFYLVTRDAVLTCRIYAAKVIDSLRPTVAFGTDKEGKTKAYLDYLKDDCGAGFVDTSMKPSDSDHLVVLQTCCGLDDYRYDVTGVIVAAQMR